MCAMTAGIDKSALGRLAALVAQRRVQLGMNKIDVARAAVVTITTYGNVERGESVRDVTYGKIEPVLGWAIGSCNEILAGGEPTLVEPSSAEGVVFSPVTADDLGEVVGQVIQDAVIAVEGTNLSTDHVRKIKQNAVEELRRRGIIKP
jgi:transcriptional regulator with XRE-family HTH domain